MIKRHRTNIGSAFASALFALLLLSGGGGQARAEEKRPAPKAADSPTTDGIKRALRMILGDSTQGRSPAPGGGPGSTRPPDPRRESGLPRLDSRRHSLEVDIEKVRADTLFAPFREHLRTGRLDLAREALRAVVTSAHTPVEREVAEFDLVEVDFFAARFDSAAAAYRTFAQKHPRGYLTNDAISRLFQIDDNSASGERPLALFAQAARESRLNRPDSASALLSQAAERFPGSPLDDDIMIALGDVALSLPNPTLAIGYYQAVADSLTESPLAPVALMRIGAVHAEVGQDFPAAILAYENVLERFPESIEANEARKLIERLRRRT